MMGNQCVMGNKASPPRIEARGCLGYIHARPSAPRRASFSPLWPASFVRWPFFLRGPWPLCRTSPSPECPLLCTHTQSDRRRCVAFRRARAPLLARVAGDGERWPACPTVAGCGRQSGTEKPRAWRRLAGSPAAAEGARRRSPPCGGSAQGLGLWHQRRQHPLFGSLCIEPAHPPPHPRPFCFGPGFTMRCLASWVLVAAALVGSAAVLAATVVADAPSTADQIADTLLSSLNESVDPCDDAYEWVCGGWRSKNPPPPSAPYTGTFFDGRLRVDAEVDSLLRAPPLASSKAGVFYASCMNASGPEEDLAPLARFRPALTALTAPNASYGAAVRAIATLAAAGVDETVFGVFVVTNYYQAGTMLVEGTAPELTAAEPAFTGTTAYDASVRAAYKKMLVSLAGTASDAGLLGDTPVGSSAATAVAELAAAFESQLIAYSNQRPPNDSSIRAGLVTGAQRFDVDTFVGSQLGLQASVRDANRSSLVQELVALMVDGVGLTLPASVSFNTFESYVGSVEQWIKAAVAPNGGGLQPLQAYLAVTAAREYADLDLLGAAPRKAVEAYTAAVEGLTAPPPRRDRCIKRVSDMFPTEAGQAFTSAHLPAADKAFASAMTEDVRAATSRLVNQSDWLDVATKAAVQEKLSAMRMLVGEDTPAAGPENTSGVVVSADDYPASFLSARGRLWRDQWARAAAPPDRAVALQPTTMNAWYWTYENTVVLTAGTCAGRAPLSRAVRIERGARAGHARWCAGACASPSIGLSGAHRGVHG